MRGWLGRALAQLTIPGPIREEYQAWRHLQGKSRYSEGSALTRGVRGGAPWGPLVPGIPFWGRRVNSRGNLGCSDCGLHRGSPCG